ncbi:hypothetical protein D9758_008737 [Tetrapyrgos nigripes]|uniref:F-box domain-containing protein n=1 Tax=Tetrapyrgos nigripes TaxID=182062 RepID=A0A8H5D4R8_9AGAR|nr:hypothetical protein D9758_008737 [Tetrapyrgos nigripes]
MCVIRDSVTYTEHAKRKTVTALDVVYALKRSGRTLYGFGRLRSDFIPPMDLTPSLPNEIVSDIFSYLRPASLADLTRVSRRLSAVADHLLYSSIFIKDLISESSPVPWRTSRCCESVLSRTYRASSVRRFHIRWLRDQGFPPTYVHVAPTLARLSETLDFFTTIESLELLLGPADTLRAISHTNDGEIHIIERVIFNHSFPHLQFCSLGAEWSKLSPSFSGILVSFLSSLHSLRQLKLPEHCASLDLPSSCLPSLTSFRGSPGAASCLLPGRPVQFLSLVGQDSDVTRENLLRITQTSLPLKDLDLSGMSVRPVLISNVAAYLPDLEVLKIKLALRHTLHYALSGIGRLTLTATRNWGSVWNGVEPVPH